MERIKVLCRMIAIIACTVFACTFIADLYPSSPLSATAYDDLLAQYQTIYDKLQITDDVSQLISKEEFQNEVSEEELLNRVITSIQGSKNAMLYSEETINEVANQYIEIYKSQKEVAKDPVLSKAAFIIRVISGAMVLASMIMIFFIQYAINRKKNKKDN